jgi:TrpR-related protein YerC/YecD
MNNWENSKTDNLIKAILALKTPKEAKEFLRDLLTTEEIIEFGLRFEVAKMLLKKIPYTVITEKTGLSSTTIARVAKWLNGKTGGYRTIINRLHHHNSNQMRKGLS